ncbi:MAG: MBL fold metallo-hydrolase [Terriglobales bacterium]
MFTKIFVTSSSRAIVFWLMSLAIAVSAQTAPGNEQLGKQTAKEEPGKASGNGTLTAAMVKTGLVVISGGGCNSVLRMSANGFILVDGKLPGNYDEIWAKARKVSFSEQPIRLLIDTDYHENHSGNNAKFIAAGAQVLAQENVKQTLENYDPPGGKIALPTRTYDHDFTVKLGGVEVQVMHFGNAHTNGDTVVYFPNLKVVAVGDLLAAAPDPDYSAGGSLLGWGPVLAQVLKLDFDIAVPGTGPTVTRSDVEAFKNRIDTLVSRANVLVKNGVPKSELMAQLKTDDLGWQLKLTGEQVDRFYAELLQAK